MWEILLEKAPYEQMDAVEAGQAIVEGKKLEIPAWAPAEYASLLSDCWHDDPAVRPSFNDIYLRIEVPPSPPPPLPLPLPRLEMGWKWEGMIGHMS
jgi:hypothetical protein